MSEPRASKTEKGIYLGSTDCGPNLLLLFFFFNDYKIIKSIFNLQGKPFFPRDPQVFHSHVCYRLLLKMHFIQTIRSISGKSTFYGICDKVHI